MKLYRGCLGAAAARSNIPSRALSAASRSVSTVSAAQRARGMNASSQSLPTAHRSPVIPSFPPLSTSIFTQSRTLASVPLTAPVDDGQVNSVATMLNTQRTPLLDVADAANTREYIRHYFHDTYNKTEDLFEILKGEAPYYLKSEPLRHPPIFYLGHTACFYINKLLLAKVIRHRVNPKIEHMCAVGVDEMSWDDLNTDHYDWPSISEVQSYRTHVRDIVDNVIQTLPLEQRIGWESDWWPVLMGIEHENIHTETSSAIFRQVDLSKIQPSPKWPICPIGAEHPAPVNDLVAQPAAEVVFDKTKENAKYYGWDNEFGQKVVPVAEHRASKFLVSNAEFLEFVEDGGYHDRQWWSDEGWTWVSFEKKGGLSGQPKDHPRWWVPTNGQGASGQSTGDWKLRCLQEEIPMPWSWPVCVNQLEAKAFCNWKSARDGKSLRLPSEAEWYSWRASGGADFGGKDQPAWAPNQAPGNINLDYYASECPVDQFEWGDSGLFDVVGNVWQWTESPIDALPGYEVHPLYDDFSSPTFDGLHSLIKGGSWISIGCNGATKDSRYAFRRHFYQHAGFRYVESDQEVDQSMTVMETDPEVAKELDAHYTVQPVLPGLEPFPVTCAQLVLDTVTKAFAPAAGADESAVAEALRGLRFAQLGCSVGRTCFELAPVFGEIIGFDQTARRIQHAVRLQEGSVARFTTPQDGDIQDFHGLSLESLGLDTDEVRDRVHFWQADACNIDVYKHGTFDVVLAANVLESLYAPKQFLETLHSLTNPGGLVILSTTGNWCKEATPPENWLGGYKCETSGENVRTNDAVEEALVSHFEKIGEETCVPAVSTEGAQTFKVANSNFTVWRRKL